jgi:hypothetical protein
MTTLDAPDRTTVTITALAGLELLIAAATVYGGLGLAVLLLAVAAHCRLREEQ